VDPFDAGGGPSNPGGAALPGGGLCGPDGTPLTGGIDPVGGSENRAAWAGPGGGGGGGGGEP